MQRANQLRTLLPDIDPTIAVVQAIHAEEQLHTHSIRRKMSDDSKISLSAVLLVFAIVIASTGLTESPREATAIMERVAVRAEAAQRIAPETRETVLKLLATRHYDCDRVKCDEQLQVRNRLARERIRQAIFNASFASDAAEHDANSSR